MVIGLFLVRVTGELNTNKKNNEVKTSGIELAMALMVAPLTPSDKFLPTYSDAVRNPSPALQIIKQHMVMITSGINIPMFPFR